MDQIKESIDIIVQFVDNNQAEHVHMTKLPQFNLQSTRSLYSIKQCDIPSIRNYFKNKNWLLLPTYTTSNAMYLCDRTEVVQKVSEHLLETKAYTLIEELNASNRNYLEYYLNDLVDQVQSKLKGLLQQHYITHEQYKQMTCNEPDKLQLNSIVFLPDTRLKTVPFRPLIICASGLTTNITRYLHGFLQSLYCLVASSSTFTSGIDAVQATEIYAKNGFLHATTLFVTLEIKDLDIIFSHEHVLETLQRFLHDHVSCRQTPGLSHETIISLVRLVLQTQYFIYDDKLYRQTKGGASDSPLAKLIADIYLFYWQQDLFQYLTKRKEVFGRCFNKIFLTWNGSKRKLRTILDMFKVKQPHMAIHLSMGSSIHYLDNEISQTDGILRTKVYGPCLTEPYTLPYLDNYPPHRYVTMIRTILIRAVRSCTNLLDFQHERSFIYSTCLFNLFPLDFITNCIHQFYNAFNPSKIDFNYDELAYQTLRQRVITCAQLSSMLIGSKRPWHDDNHNLDTESNRKRMKISLIKQL